MHIFFLTLKTIKSEDIRKIVLRLNDQDLSSSIIVEHLADHVSETTINR